MVEQSFCKRQVGSLILSGGPKCSLKNGAAMVSTGKVDADGEASMVVTRKIPTKIQETLNKSFYKRLNGPCRGRAERPVK